VIASQDEEVLIGLAGGRENTGLSLADQLQGFLDFEATNIEIFTPTEPTSLEVNGLPAMSADFSGSLFGDTVAGRITYVIPLPGHFFVIFGNAPPERWHFEGLPLYLAILESVEFMEASLLPEGCPVSVDPTYAYSPDNPIRAGEGDAFSGPSLERAYLDSLAGPNGEPVTYERLGSQPQGETILDIYQVSFGHQSVSLYLDEYSGEPFRVPKGFSCRQ
jgi:hypothetical protein